jgi:putative tryptophan/tyrosine transport system substrate-binding protein
LKAINLGIGIWSFPVRCGFNAGFDGNSGFAFAGLLGGGMRRRDVLTMIGGSALAWPLAARAQQRERLRTIGVLMNYAEYDPEGEVRFTALRDRLGELGWAEGRNVAIEVRWCAARPDLMLVYATELVSRPADVVVAQGTLVVSVLKKLTGTIPIVFTQVADPVGSGFVSNYARPDANITGFAEFDTAVAGKWIEALKELVPQVARVTVLVHSDQVNHERFLHAIEAAASTLDVKVAAAEVHDRSGLEQAIAGLAGQTDGGLIVLPSPLTNTQRAVIIELAARYRLPAVYPYDYYVKDGGLLCYGTNQVDEWPGAAGYVDRILKGEKVADLPVQELTKYGLAINLKAAKALGLKVPQSLLARADEVIE